VHSCDRSLFDLAIGPRPVDGKRKSGLCIDAGAIDAGAPAEQAAPSSTSTARTTRLVSVEGADILAPVPYPTLRQMPTACRSRVHIRQAPRGQLNSRRAPGITWRLGADPRPRPFGRTTGCLSPSADLFTSPTASFVRAPTTTGSFRVQPRDDYECRIRHPSPGPRCQISGGQARGPPSSAIRSSTISRRATRSCLKWRGALSRQGQEVSTCGNVMVSIDRHPPYEIGDPIISTWKCASTAICARRRFRWHSVFVRRDHEHYPRTRLDAWEVIGSAPSAMVADLKSAVSGTWR